MTTNDPSPALVLVVDDHPDLRHILAQAVALRGYETITAPNGPEAVATARRMHPAVVLLDICMPEMDGFDVLTALRAMEGRPPRVIMMTATVNEGHRKRAQDLGVDDYLVKGENDLVRLCERIEAQMAAYGGPVAGDAAVLN